MVAVPQLGVLIMDDGRQFGDSAVNWVVASRPTSVRVALEGAPERPGLRTLDVVPPEKFNLRTAVRAAAAEGLLYIAAPRSVDDPLTVFVDAARGAARSIDAEHLGFAVVLAESQLTDLRRMAVVADLSDPITTGIAAWAAVGMAVVTHAELDMLVLGADEDSQPADWREGLKQFKVRGSGEELVSDALERAMEHGLTIRWRGLGNPMDKPTAVLRAVVQGDYDMVVDDLPPINVGPRPGRRRRVQAALSQAGSNATAYRLVRDAPCGVTFVLDAARMGLAPPGVVQTGAAALALGVVSAAAVSGPAAAETEVATQAAITQEAGSPAAAAVAQAQPAPALDYSTMTKADLDELTAQRSQTIKERNAVSRELKQTQSTIHSKNANLGKLADQLAPADAELDAAEEKAAETQREATYASVMSSGPLSVLPGGPSAAEAAAAQAAAEQAQEELEELEATYERLYQRQATLTQDVKVLEAEARQLSAEHERLSQEADALSTYVSELTYTLNPVVRPISSAHPISTSFGTGGGNWSSGYHTGTDFAAPSGTSVVAAKNGKVVEAGWGGAYGNTIVIEHEGGVQTRYAHLSSINVSVGQTVSAGAHIGNVGSTGNSTGPHLHFEVMDAQGNFQNPAAWLGI